MNQKQAKKIAQDMLHDFWLTYTEHGENYMEQCKNDKEREKAVSYTHLTLPTIAEV